MKVEETKGNELEEFKVHLMEYHPYDPKGVCKKNYAKIQFNWLRKTYSRP